MSNKTVYLIPNGTKNLQQIFPTVDWNGLDSYYVQVSDEAGDIVATSPINQVNPYNNPDEIRIHFLNYLGAFDAVNFLKPTIAHEDTSTEFQKSLPSVLSKTDFSFERFNIRSNDTFTAKRKSNENEMQFLQECWDSPVILLEWKGTEGQPDSYIPIVKITGKMEKLKNNKEFTYDFIIQFKLSNEYIIIRN